MPSNKYKLPVVSLFTGAGGLDLGLELAGEGAFDFRAWIEHDEDCRATLKKNNQQLESHPAFFKDVETTDPHQLMVAADIRPRETFLLAGGPPCQAFSTAGLRNTVSSASGKAVHRYFDMVKILKPRFFLFENVRGLLSAALVHRPLAERNHPKEVPDDPKQRLGSVLDQLVLPTFNRLGYEVVYGIICSADYGTAQVRHRVFILGSRDREFKAGIFRKKTSRQMQVLDLVPPTHHEYAPYEPLKPWRTLRDAIGNIRPAKPKPEDTYSYSPERAAIFEKFKPGENWKAVRDNPANYPDGFLEEIMGGAIKSGGGKEGFWRRLPWDSPTPTLTAQPQQLASSLCHPSQIRPLSVPEYAAIQDFPSDYIFCGSKSSRYRQIGNAVPLRMAKAVGRSILAIAKRNS